MGDDANNLTELGDTLKLLLDILTIILGVLLGVLGVGLALALVPILVATTLELFAQVLSKDGGESPQSTGGFEVSNNTNNDHRRCLENGYGIDDLTLVHDGAGTVDASDNVGHTRLIGAKRGEMARGGWIIVLGEGTNASGVVFGALFGEESQVTTARGFEFAVGHGGGVDEKEIIYDLRR